jgi:hypothetical protein
VAYPLIISTVLQINVYNDILLQRQLLEGKAKWHQKAILSHILILTEEE